MPGHVATGGPGTGDLTGRARRRGRLEAVGVSLAASPAPRGPIDETSCPGLGSARLGCRGSGAQATTGRWATPTTAPGRSGPQSRSPGRGADHGRCVRHAGRPPGSPEYCRRGGSIPRPGRKYTRARPLNSLPLSRPRKWRGLIARSDYSVSTARRCIGSIRRTVLVGRERTADLRERPLRARGAFTDPAAGTDRDSDRRIAYGNPVRVDELFREGEVAAESDGEMPAGDR